MNFTNTIDPIFKVAFMLAFLASISYDFSLWKKPNNGKEKKPRRSLALLIILNGLTLLILLVVGLGKEPFIPTELFRLYVNDWVYNFVEGISRD